MSQNPRVWANRLTFNDGTSIDLERNDIVVFVGPNNAGKSASLKEIANLLKQKSTDSKIVKSVEISREGSDIEFQEFFESVSKKKNQGNPHPHFQGYGYSIYEPHIRDRWGRIESELGELTPFFVSQLNTESRLQVANPAPNIRLTQDAPSHPIHHLQRNDNLELKFSGYFRQAFGADLIVHRNAGNEVPLYVGERPICTVDEDRVSAGYLERLESLSPLHEQGDGMRSFVGVLLSSFISHHSILFIDEPEAFLHPPQARLMGGMLAKDLPSSRQLFLATHSEDFLKGLLETNSANLKIIRIQRDGEINRISSLVSEDLESVWGDSLLRHSNVLSGVFHSQVVICESDSDCRFFSALVASLYESGEGASPDILFIHCGGKHRIPTVVNALNRLNVPLKVISDFDLINASSPLKDIFQGLGGQWLEVSDDWSLVKSKIEEKNPELLADDVKREVSGVLLSVNERIFPSEKVGQINKILKRSSAWSLAKGIGAPFIPSGDATCAFARMQEKFASVGLHVLEIGELESFVKSVGNHGPRWVSEVLARDLMVDPELATAREFVTKLNFT